jgi:UDP-glucuronate 4-epimerase
MKRYILVTGCAGFIGFHLSNKLLKKKYSVVGIDNINNYYSKKLKINRIAQLNRNSNFIFIRGDIKNNKFLKKIFLKYHFEYVLHLAAQAGVRYSLKEPRNYLENNVLGFFNILECIKNFKVKHLIFASSSSVYGEQKKYPLKEYFNITNPEQFYAATKITNEVMAASYSNLYNLKVTGLRFFTVYGPWGRPDMAIYNFTNKLFCNKKINIFNYGNHSRDFTYIDDVVNYVYKIFLFKKNFFNKKFNVFNLGNNNPVKLKKLIKLIEKNFQRKFRINLIAKQKGDVQKTFADIRKIKKITGSLPSTSIEEGIKKFSIWYKNYYKI